MEKKLSLDHENLSIQENSFKERNKILGEPKMAFLTVVSSLTVALRARMSQFYEVEELSKLMEPVFSNARETEIPQCS
jgi:hypothetical protein